MDYEKKYKEALNLAKSYYGKGTNEFLDTIFPELTESEDERIRKEMVDFIQWAEDRGMMRHDYHQAKRPAAWLAYLEKQKEPHYSPLCNTIKDKIREYIASHFIADTVVKTDMKSIVKAIEEGVRLGKEEQKPNIELIQRSWYMEGYIDGKFEMEPMWNLETGEGGPRYEKNEKYGQPLEQKSIEDAVKEVTRDKESAEKFLKTAGIVDENGNLAEIYRSEQKPVEWSEDYRDEDLRTRFAFYTYKDEDGVLYLSNVFVEETSRNKGFGTKILAAAEKVAEVMGVITIRLKVKQESPANAWYRKHGYGYMTFEDGYDWLEKTLEYLKPSKQEWSEEDIKKIRSEEYTKGFNDAAFGGKLKEWSEEAITNGWTGGDLEKYLSCLQRLGTGNPQQPETSNSKWFKEHCRRQSYWKPSEEQMDALNEIINTLAASKHPHESDYLFNILNGLQKNLKKL